MSSTDTTTASNGALVWTLVGIFGGLFLIIALYAFYRYYNRQTAHQRAIISQDLQRARIASELTAVANDVIVNG